MSECDHGRDYGYLLFLRMKSRTIFFVFHYFHMFYKHNDIFKYDIGLSALFFVGLGAVLGTELGSPRGSHVLSLHLRHQHSHKDSSPVI